METTTKQKDAAPGMERNLAVMSIVMTSVDDVRSSMCHIHTVEFLQECLSAEYDNMNRKSAIRVIQSRINQLEKSN